MTTPRSDRSAAPIELHAWRMVADPYAPPEAGRQAIIGAVKNDPRGRPDGREVRTSRIVAADGRVVMTESGTRYRLCDVSDGYRDWLREHRPRWDPENPVTVIEGPA